MYICRHCGLEYRTDEAVLCPRCQAPKGKGTNFCPFCGTQVTQEEHSCKNCGVDMDCYGGIGGKSKLCAGLLAIFLGKYGVHNFYLGYTKRAVIQLVSVVGVFVLLFMAFLSTSGKDFMLLSSGDVAFALTAMLLFIVVTSVIRIWSFIEGILIFCGKIEKDGKGRHLR